MKFNCTQCGLCCSRIGRVLADVEASPFREELLKFPYKALDNGACEKYDPATKQCTVYETRPDICNVDKMKKYYKAGISKSEYYSLMEKSCLDLQRQELGSGTSDFHAELLEGGKLLAKEVG